ncbi:peptidylprolyl isomerase [Colwellia psychrerythraea]|uniref:Peptidyl-prolyl cis-trans isomerase n=1 Tax=Colwellia psychrerythraea TaxID=28229 RepID=A0A099L325_COLPS|nr:peptidylprolyl isomerase [Colwellia psychrerythraea]KGJ96850.1 peptidyl-prolyl cis-trans isomerase cyclophilin type [Colwellia psychrerythraea]
MNNHKKIITSLFLMFTLTACCGGDAAIEKVNNFITKQAIDKADPAWKTKLDQPPLLGFTPGKDYFWELQTNQGNLTIKLLTESAPMHVSSTIYLTKLGFYDGLTFHRVIPGFMAQGGDPTGTGAGNPGYKYDGEFNDNFEGELGHNESGTLSMANAGPGTDGSQFFLTFKATPFLNGKHTVFGKVVTDLENSLTKIEALGSRSGKTSEEVKIIKASIRIANSKE